MDKYATLIRSLIHFGCAPCRPMFHFSRCTPQPIARNLHTSTPCLKKVKIKDPNRPKQKLTPKELAMNTKRRIQKAERDERVDISMALTEVKTYHGGFTRPRDIRASNWFPGGTYIAKNKVYEKPPSDAYRPYTVSILETRYSIQTKEPGRPDVPEHHISVCQEQQFSSFVKQKNLTRIDGGTRVMMDAAWWPFLHRQINKLKPEAWWNDGEDPKKLRMEALGVDADWEKNTPESIREYFPNPNQYRNNGTKIVELTPTKTIKPVRSSKTIGEIRKLYEPLLENEPFWRPLVSVTLATRPLTQTLDRLCKAHTRGLPFYASIEPEDRKTVFSFPARMRLMRLQRMRELTIEIAKKLQGYQGGFIGIRFDHNDRGRAIRGERLAEQLPDSLRVIRVGLGRWYAYEQERALWEEMAADAGVDIEISALDDWGRKLDVQGDIVAGQDAVEGMQLWQAEEEDEGDEEEDEEDEEDEGNEEEAGNDVIQDTTELDVGQAPVNKTYQAENRATG